MMTPGVKPMAPHRPVGTTTNHPAGSEMPTATDETGPAGSETEAVKHRFRRPRFYR